jgi:TatA/E family protein of Tat protein translocase
MFGSFGAPELLVIAVVALLLFGPKNLPELGKSLGEALRGFKKASDEPEPASVELADSPAKPENATKS